MNKSVDKRKYGIYNMIVQKNEQKKRGDKVGS